MTLLKKDVLGVKINDISLNEAVQLVVGWLKTEGRHYVVTPNPEFVMIAQRDNNFREVLNRADLAIPDGVGLKQFAGMQNVVGGVYLLEELCKACADLGFTTSFLGGREGVAKKAAECLQKKYPGLNVVLAADGPEVDSDGQKIGDQVFTIPASDLLFVGFGQVKQEKWIAANLDSIPVKVAMGVGGSFDEISGKVPRAPKWIHALGLKWLFRLVLQPQRFKRQLKIWQFAWFVTRKGGTVKS